MAQINQQVFEGNGLRIEYPIGYRSFKDYIATLQLNIKIAKNIGRDDLLPGLRKSLREARKAVSK